MKKPVVKNKTLEIREKKRNPVQRISIYHNGDNLMLYPGRVVKIDNVEFYRQNRFSNYGEEQLIKFAIECGFKDIPEFFAHFEKLTGGQDFHGVIRWKTGTRFYTDGFQKKPITEYEKTL